MAVRRLGAVALLIGCVMIMGVAATPSTTGNVATAVTLPQTCMPVMQATPATNAPNVPGAPASPPAQAPMGPDMIPGVCNFLNGGRATEGCCANGLPEATPLPDISNCTTTCQSYYISFYCYFSCTTNTVSGDNSRVCNAPLRQLFEACQGCPVLNRGRRVDVNSDYAAFLSVNDITAVSQSGQPCDDFIAAGGRRCEETRAPVVTRITATEPGTTTAVTSIIGTEFGTIPENPTRITTQIGRRFDICAEVTNIRPEGCTTLRAGLPLYPVSARILVEARSNGVGPTVAYTVADAFFSSEDIELVPGTINRFRACLRDFVVTPLVQGNFILSITAQAVNTFGTASSAALNNDANNQVSIPVTLPFTFPTVASPGFVLGEITGNIMDQQIGVCNEPTTGPTDGILYIGTPNWAVPTASSDFTTNSVSCCETPNDGDQYATQCTISGGGLTNALNVVYFLANEEETTFSLLRLTVSGVFEAQGSITLVNSRIDVRDVLQQFSSMAAFALFQAQDVRPTFENPIGVNVALRGAAGNLVTIGENALLRIRGTANSGADENDLITVGTPTAFLILLNNIELIVRSQPATVTNENAIELTDARLIVAEFAKFSTSKTTTFLIRSKIVQYTQTPGRILIGGPATRNNGDIDLTNDRITEVRDEQGTPTSAVVVVAGLFQSTNLPNMPLDITTYVNVPLRITVTSAGQTTTGAEGLDIGIIPTNAEIPDGDMQANGVLTIPTNSATLQLCGTVQQAILIPTGGRLLVAPVTDTSAQCAVQFGTAVGTPVYSLAVGSLDVRRNGIVELVGVGSTTFNPIRITTGTDGLLIARDSILRVTLGAGISTTAIENLELFSIAGANAAFDCSTRLPPLRVTNPGNRLIDLGCRVVDGRTQFFLALSEVQTPTLPQVNPALFSSNSEYCVIVNQNAGTYTRTDFLNAVSASFAGTSTNLISVTNFAADQTRTNQLRISFRCLDLNSVAEADRRCQAITNSAQTNTGFRTAIQATTVCNPTIIVGADDNDDSNHGLYGLFGLIAIPLICCCVIFLVIRNSRRRADNQYMQDAATFSNVASGPQPIAQALPAPAYDLGKALPYPYPAGPVVAVPAY